MKFVRKIKEAAGFANKPVSADLYAAAGEERLSIPLIESLPDEELSRLNELLPWASFVLDSGGRMFGAPYSRSKRSSAQPMPDYRAGILDSEFGLKGRAVLEAGCFEGNHTVGLAQSGALVTAFDGRVENVVKTQVRCSFFAIKANIVYWNAETQKPGYIADRFDLLHHVGVLYHLSKPIAHLASLLPLIETGVLLDTHVADDMETQVDTFQGLEYRYANFREAGREPPFAGLTPSAQWIHSEDLLSTIRYFGFKNARIIEDRSEPNGKRVCIIASRN